MESKGLFEIKVDRCIFKNKENTIIIAIYVDDGLIIGENMEDIRKVLKSIKDYFEMTINENPSMYVGMGINLDNNQLTLSQEHYIDQLLKNLHMENSKPVNTPIAVTSNVEHEESEKTFPYRQAVGSLLYLSNKTRPDIAFGVNFSSRYLEKPSDKNIQDVKRILRYLNGSREKMISFKKDSKCMKLIAYCDADFAGDLETRKSTTGFIIMYAGGPISWCSRKQPITALSTTEAEFIAAADCIKELVHLKQILEEISGEKIECELNIDNQNAIQIIKNKQLNRRTKHIDVRYHFIWEKVTLHEIKINYISSSEQTADIFTKTLDKIKFQKFSDTLMT